jgi:cysteinyl-tRNA synthetase
VGPPNEGMDLELPDTLSGRTMAVRPARPGPIALYVCGPTVYDGAHVGHARTYLHFDLARRFLEAEGRPVRHVMNITDVEDKIDRRAAALRTTWRTLARRVERGFLADLAALGIETPSTVPRASDYVPEMIAVARTLARTGRVRRTEDGWVYDPPNRPQGTNFLTTEELARHAVLEGGRALGSGSDGGRTFLLWKPQARPLPSWPSPWGRGVPGWHLECFAMARRLLRVPVDLHGGGPDLVYPHHYAENEIALTLAGTRFARTFLHTGFVLQDGAKMSKSTGRLVPLRSALASVGPGAVRWYVLSRPPLDRFEWDPRALLQAEEEYATLRARLSAWLAPGGSGRLGARAALDLEEGCRRDLAQGLRIDLALGRLRRFSEALGRDATGRVARGEGKRTATSLRRLAARTGLPLV